MRQEITIGIEAPSKEYAQRIAEALVQIKNSLSDKDLVDLARLLKENPGIIKTAKKFLG